MNRALAAEWIKIRTLRSTGWLLLLTLLLGAGLGLLAGNSIRRGYANLSEEMRQTFDPVAVGFYGLTLAQLALVVFGVLTAGSEYGTGMIRVSLAAEPRRTVFFAAKLAAGGLVAFGCSLVTAVTTFFVAQWALGPYGVSLGSPGALRATAGAAVYMTAMCVLAMGVATLLRSSALSLGIMIPLLFLGSQGLGNVPKLRLVTQFLPDQAGLLIMQSRAGHSLLGPRSFGPWTGLAILAVWCAVALAAAHLALLRRDA